MTREEAIIELNTFKIGAKSELGENALDMAIKALEQQQKILDACKKIENAKSKEDLEEFDFAEVFIGLFNKVYCEDTISREDVYRILDENSKNVYEFIEQYIDDVRLAIEKLPSVIPTKAKGYWINDCPIMTEEGLVRVIRCSCCNEQRKDYYGVSKNFCPNCGAKMESEVGV